MAKVVASEYAVKAADRGIQILGGMGYSAETDMQRYWRDARLYRIGPITNEMARNVDRRGPACRGPSELRGDRGTRRAGHRRRARGSAAIAAGSRARARASVVNDVDEDVGHGRRRRRSARRPRRARSPRRRPPTRWSTAAERSSAGSTSSSTTPGSRATAMVHKMSDETWAPSSTSSCAARSTRPAGGPRLLRTSGGADAQPQGRQHRLDQRHLRRRVQRQLLGREGRASSA